MGLCANMKYTVVETSLLYIFGSTNTSRDGLCLDNMRALSSKGSKKISPLMINCVSSAGHGGGVTIYSWSSKVSFIAANSGVRITEEGSSTKVSV